MKTEIFTYSHLYHLESGEILSGFQLSYSTIGQLNEQKDNVIWVCHALTGNAKVNEWWPGMVGEAAVFDPKDSFIICVNMLGSCYGSTNALSINPATSEPYYHDFPFLTNRDIVGSFDLLRQHLGIEKINILAGGSMGGQQVLEWGIIEPDRFDYLIPVATNALHSPWGIAFNESQRMAIEADPTWKEKAPHAGIIGMKAARSVALLSYRNYAAYVGTQSENNPDVYNDFRASSYQRYQGEKLAKRFHAFAYWTLSKAMDSHHVGRGREGVEAALNRIKAKTLVIGVESDVLFPVDEQKFLARHIPKAEYVEVQSKYGHDGFLIETDQITEAIREVVTNF
ncbi:MAG: homoserine O-acetyltransferase [Bacteroidetes bacterium]|nr:homoserine O-acetyltransferase [Bacteroidota bacterium]MCB0842250.1 homoserine O-acetyltransferase [Bacteroidota bacterium]